MDIDIYAVISLILRVFAIGIILFYIIPRQFLEATRPRDWLTGLRWRILILVIFMILSSLPVVVYQQQRIDGTVSDTFRNVASISSNLSYLSMSILLILIYNYKNADGEKMTARNRKSYNSKRQDDKSKRPRDKQEQ